ncbi:hypothetical protein SAMN04515691_0285 [Leifsonia sp. 98AMF]|uniref:hypothetical protein n=1 Tax=unclassified Leifsonia TaxID=2663824 RepID=UPI00087B7E99|nr:MULTISPECIES: hypothetical protein [unclassified Leifsonia]SDH70125.1 hypothetical protein SAMN04515690_3735 [Leifsonia sp. 197AMF]SDI69748.1 hypothetical protein SAMN04515684_0054 [Leifsonia sp. 466MF]SDK21445.1 hypothetical protein SAMN04515683_2697 [Leifsonia sp. 157MF]SDN72111.1 hypothetical protein SAMN04515686_2255 [Leifsonia sp. 509MF]SEN36220.1 hypothetical protein SAMN04515685_2681 [Leifsonia sp. 467MF]
MSAETYRALFLHPDEDEDDFSAQLPVVSAAPPALIRAATTYAGAQAVAVYRLAEASAWPEAAAFLYEKTIPGTVPDGEQLEQVETPDD